MLAAVVAGARLLWAAILAGRGEMTIGDLTVFGAAVAGVQSAQGSLVRRLGAVHQALLLFGHCRHVAHLPPELASTRGPVPVPSLRRGIEMRDVWFRYGDHQPWILRGVNVTIPHGRSASHRADRTSLLISHRLGSIRDADHIALLSRGVVAEQGNHHELVAADGEYARLFRLQASGYVVEAGA
jgi:ABC-type multidrug transport system fused ATPase/permease subunit